MRAWHIVEIGSRGRLLEIHIPKSESLPKHHRKVISSLDRLCTLHPGTLTPHFDRLKLNTFQHAVLLVVRPWPDILKQRSCEETLLIAIPAINLRSKIAARVFTATSGVVVVYFVISLCRYWPRQFSVFGLFRLALLAGCLLRMTHLQDEHAEEFTLVRDTNAVLYLANR